MRDTASRCDMSSRIRKHDGFASSRVVETTDDACQAHNTIPQEQPIAQRLLQLAEQPQSLLCAHRGRPCSGHGSGNHRIFNVGGWCITVWMVRQCCFRSYFNFRQAMHKNMFPECVHCITQVSCLIASCSMSALWPSSLRLLLPLLQPVPSLLAPQVLCRVLHGRNLGHGPGHPVSHCCHRLGSPPQPAGVVLLRCSCFELLRCWRLEEVCHEYSLHVSDPMHVFLRRAKRDAQR